jgi:hypothetical protein
MKKILFIMFQGLGTNQKRWNEHTESRFLDRLKELGSVYTYQDKINNIWHYNKSSSDPDSMWYDYDNDIDIDLSYVRCNTHIKLVYHDLIQKYKNLDNYIIIPIGFSLGGYMGLYFVQHYKNIHPTLFKHVIMLDSSGFSPDNMKQKLEAYSKYSYIKNITNNTYKKMLQRLKTIPENGNGNGNGNSNSNSNSNDSDTKTQLITLINQINNINIYFRLLSAAKYLKFEFSIPTTLFVNIQTSDKNIYTDSMNKLRLYEIELYKKHNPDTFTSIIVNNQSHYLYTKIQSTKEIIKYIKSISDC